MEDHGAANAPGDRHFVVALDRGLKILQCFDTDRELLSNQELAHCCGLAKSTVSRLTYTLTQLDYLEPGPSGAYALGIANLLLSGAQLDRLRLRQACLPAMQQLALGTGCEVNLSIPEAHSMLVIESCAPPLAEAPLLAVGARMPMATSAAGHAHLASLAAPDRAALAARIQRINPAGWPAARDAFDAAVVALAVEGCCRHVLSEAGMTQLAMQVCGLWGETAAIVCLTAVPDRAGEAQAWQPALHACAAEISSRLKLRRVQQLGALPPADLVPVPPRKGTARRQALPVTEAPAAQPEQETDRRFVSSLARGLQVLGSFGSAEERLGIHDIAQRCRLPSSTAARLVHTLELTQHLRRTEAAGRWQLAREALHLSGKADDQLRILRICRPFLHALAQETGLQVAMGTTDEAGVLYLESCRGNAMLRRVFTAGVRMPLATTSVGRALYALQHGEARAALEGPALTAGSGAASLARLRASATEMEQLGCCTSFGEWQADVNGIAAPMPLGRDQPALAINIGGPAACVSPTDLVETVRPRLLSTIRQLQERMGFVC